MPTNKNKMQYQLDDEYFKKFLYIMKKQKRKSQSDLSIYIIEKYIDDFEEKYGKIEEDK